MVRCSAHIVHALIARFSAANSRLRAVSQLMHKQRTQLLPADSPNSSLVAIPRSVLKRILEHCDLMDRLAVAETCNALRITTCALPHIWSCVRASHELFNPGKNRRILYILERSCPDPVDLHLTVDSITSVEDFEDILSALLLRLQSLTLFSDIARNSVYGAIAFPSGDALTWMRLMHALSLPAPALRALFLRRAFVHWPDQSNDIHYLPDNLLSRFTLLQTLYLDDIRLSHSSACAVLFSLTTLMFESPTPVDSDNLDAIFTTAPNLETFELGAPSYASRRPSFYSLQRLKRVLINLKRAEVSFGVIDYFRHIDDFVVVALADQLEPQLQDQPLLPGPVRLYWSGANFALAQYGTRQIFGTSRGMMFTHEWPPLLASPRLLTLVIHEHVVSHLGPPRHAVHISDLCIILRNCLESRQNYWDSSGAFIEAGPLFECPALKTLHITCIESSEHVCPTRDFDGVTYDYPSQCPCATGCTLALADVICFIRRRLRFDDSRLERLVLSGIRDIVDIDLAGVLHELQDVVVELELLPTAPHDVLRFTSNWWSPRSALDETHAAWAQYRVGRGHSDCFWA